MVRAVMPGVVIQPAASSVLSHHWDRLRYHPEQSRFARSRARFRVCAAGRRSGKSVLARRRGVEDALLCPWPDGKYAWCAPTRDQAKRLHWESLKRLVPDELKVKVSEGELSVWLVNGARISVVGMDKPQRVEGEHLDGAILDEFADMKAEAWSQSVRPSLSTDGRPGWAIFIGKPRGRNHFWRLYNDAIVLPGWDRFHWPSSDILPASEIAAAERELDELTFAQEYEASFVNFTGRAYYSFIRETHAARRLEYMPDRPLVFCFDFNVDPGVAAVCQEQPNDYGFPDVSMMFTAVLGEVYIPRNSNTPAVCRKLVKDWGHHEGRVYCYGDASGGARGTAKVEGSDWTLIKKELRGPFERRVKYLVPKANPAERSRINAVNSRFRSVDGTIHCLVDPERAPNVADDFEGVVVLEGGSGEIDKDYDEMLTHLSDGIGYYIHKKHPIFKHLAQAA